jgi:hypothetical protein
MTVDTRNDHRSHSAASQVSGSEPSRFGPKIKYYIARLTCTVRWKSLLIFGPNTFPNAISTLFEILGCLRRERGSKPRQLYLRYSDRGEGSVLNLAHGPTRSSETSEEIRFLTQSAIE